MADNDKPGSKDDSSFEDFDEELELDLFDDGSEPDSDDALSEFAEANQESAGSELQDELGDAMDDDLDNTLDEDIIDLSDDDLKQEFAALDREEAQTSGFDSVSDSDPTPTLESTGLSDSLDDKAADSDADDLYLNMTSEEFGAPDQYSAEYGTNTRPDTRASNAANKSGKASGKTASKPAAGQVNAGLPTVLAALTALSPRMIVAATAAVLLPLVLFATLGFNADQSDADENTAATFVDQSDNNAPDNSASGVSVNDSSANAGSANTNEPPPRIEPPEPARIQVPELPAAESQDPDAALVAADDEPVASDSAPERTDASQAGESAVVEADTSPAADQPNDSEAPALLAQADTGQPDPDQSTRAPIDPALARSVAAVTQDADGQPVTAEPEIAEPEPVSDHSPESALTEDASATTSSGVAVISEAESSGRNYHVVVASFATEEQARQHAASVSDEEIAAYVIPPFGSSTNYRVAVAGYGSMAEARENIPGLQAVYGSGIWPLRYPPSPPLQTISEPTGDTYIIVASFPSAELARTHAGGLVADGEQPAIIAPYPPANRYRVAVSYFDSPTNAENALPRYRQNYGEDVWLLRY